MIDLFDSGEKITHIISSKPNKSNFESFLNIKMNETNPNKILLHTDSKELTKLVLKNKDSEHSFKVVKKPIDDSKEQIFKNQNITNDEYNKNLISKNPFNLAKVGNRPVIRPKVIHVDKMSRTHSSKFMTSLREDVYKRGIY